MTSVQGLIILVVGWLLLEYSVSINLLKAGHSPPGRGTAAVARLKLVGNGISRA